MSVLLRICPGNACALLIANVLLQVTVVILAAWLLARLAGRWNAAWRHAIYLVALVCVLATPRAVVGHAGDRHCASNVATIIANGLAGQNCTYPSGPTSRI